MSHFSFKPYNGSTSQTKIQALYLGLTLSDLTPDKLHHHLVQHMSSLLLPHPAPATLAPFLPLEHQALPDLTTFVLAILSAWKLFPSYSPNRLLVIQTLAELSLSQSPSQPPTGVCSQSLHIKSPYFNYCHFFTYMFWQLSVSLTNLCIPGEHGPCLSFHCPYWPITASGTVIFAEWMNEKWLRRVLP